MNRNLKMIGKGFIYGVKHPYLDEPYKRTDGMTTIDGVLGDIGMSISQGTIQKIVGYGACILILMGIGYINSKIDKTDLKVDTVIRDNNQ